MNTLLNSPLGYEKASQTFEAMCHLLDMEAARWKMTLTELTVGHHWAATMRLRREAIEALTPLAEGAVTLHEQLLLSRWHLEAEERKRKPTEPDYMI